LTQYHDPDPRTNPCYFGMAGASTLPVYVTVGGNGRFGENRSSKRAQGVVVAIGAAMALCLLIGAAMEERNMVPASLEQTGTTALSQQALRQLEGKLSSKEVNYEVARQAVEGLPVHQQVLAVKFAAEALSSTPTTDLQECSNKDSYETIQESFTELAANISASNSTLYAREAMLKAAADEAHSAWLDAQSKYRTATAEKDSAKQAATYAAGMYTKFETAVSTGQAQYDVEKPKLDEEMAQLNEELPVLQGVCRHVMWPEACVWATTQSHSQRLSLSSPPFLPVSLPPFASLLARLPTGVLPLVPFFPASLPLVSARFVPLSWNLSQRSWRWLNRSRAVRRLRATLIPSSSSPRPRCALVALSRFTV